MGLGNWRLAEELGNTSKARRVTVMSRDASYRCKSAVEDGDVEALFERARPKPNLAELLNDRVLPFHAEHVCPLLRIVTVQGAKYCGRVHKDDFWLFSGNQ